MGYDATKVEHLCSQTTLKMGYNNKADVLLLVENSVEWVSVKKFTASFNQIDKRWVDQYADDLNMPPDVSDALKKYCGQNGFRPCDVLAPDKLELVKDKRRFFMDELEEDECNAVMRFLAKNKRKIIEYVVRGRGRASAKWMLVVEEDQNGNPARTTIVPIKTVIKHCMCGDVATTDRGNIRLGALTVQRKGGDGGKDTAQMLQFKFSPQEILGLDGVTIVDRQGAV